MMLIDIFEIKDELYQWSYDGKNHFNKIEFKPKIYILASKKKLLKLNKLFPTSYFEIKKTLKGNKEVLTLELNLKDFRKTISYINSTLKYSCEIFNSDIPLPEYYLFSKHLFPTMNLNKKDDPFCNYNIPRLKVMTLDVRTKEHLRKNINSDLITIYSNSKAYSLKKFINFFSKENPDIILTTNPLTLPYLLKQIRKIKSDFSFSRFGRDSFETSGNSYFSYNRTIYKTKPSYLKGRLHFNVKSLIYGEWDLSFPFEIARITRTTLQRANHKSVGYCISNLQLYYAYKKSFLIPKTASCVERWKSGTELFMADRGALILEPKIGYHKDIAELDFTSLFPSIMVKYNISTETLFCKCCKNNKVPGLNINICQKEKGIIPEMLEPIIKKRESYRNLKKNKADALKALLVTSFGYMGFRKSKFSRIEAHQAIQAYAREILLKAIKISEEFGFEVVHGIVDSIWVKKDDLKDLDKLINEINNQTGLKIKLEGIYKWIVFLPSIKNNNLPVPSRYYGVFQNNKIKARGIEIRKHDTPLIIKEMQSQIIHELAKTDSYINFKKTMLTSKVFLKQTIKRILLGYVSEEELAVKKRISKTEYKSRIANSIVINKLEQQGYDVHSGDVISYLISDKKNSFPDNRYNPITNLQKFKYDKKEYIKLAKKAYENLFPWFKEQLTINEALKNVNTRIETARLPL